MKKFTNHVDHVGWISRLENLEANVARLETLADAKLTRFERADMGIIMYVNWAAGLEVLAPLDQPTPVNQWFRDWLDTRGEGVMFVVFGVRDLERHKARLERLGFEVGPLTENHPDSPWCAEVNLRERNAGVVMNSNFVLGDMDYADELISFGDA